MTIFDNNNEFTLEQIQSIKPGDIYRKNFSDFAYIDYVIVSIAYNPKSDENEQYLSKMTNRKIYAKVFAYHNKPVTYEFKIYHYLNDDKYYLS